MAHGYISGPKAASTVTRDTVTRLQYTDFIDLKSMSTKFLPQQLLLEDKTVASVSKMKVLKVSSDTPDVLFVKYDYSSDFQAIPLSIRSSRSQSRSRYSLQQLYGNAPVAKRFL